MQGEEAPQDFSSTINLNLDIRIPEDYVPNMNHRLMLYKRIASMRSEDQIGSIREEIQDRFGIIPEAVENLLRYGLVKFQAEKLKIRSIDHSDGTLFFQLTEQGPVKTDCILAFIRKYKQAKLTPSGILTYHGEKLYIPNHLFETLHRLLNELASC
jgi:transcription-repair coupling factor (superfamily II helicase)